MKSHNFTCTGGRSIITPNVAKAITKAIKFTDSKAVKVALRYVCFHFRYKTLTIIATNGQTMFVSEKFDVDRDVVSYLEAKYLVSVIEARAIAKLASKHPVNVHEGLSHWKLSTVVLPGLQFSYKDYYIYSVQDILKTGTFPVWEKQIFTTSLMKSVVFRTIDFKSVIGDLMSKYEHGTEEIKQLARSNNFDIRLGFVVDYAFITISAKKTVYHSRTITYQDSDVQVESKHVDGRALTKILKCLPDKLNTFVGIADNYIQLASEGTKDKYYLHVNT